MPVRPCGSDAHKGLGYGWQAEYMALGNKLRIAYLVRPAEGGIKNHLLTLLSGLDRERFEPLVICPPGCSLYREVVQAGHEVIPLDIADGLSPSRDLRAVVRLRRILGRTRPDILHIHSAKAGMIGRAAVAGMFRRPRVILTLHSFVFDERTSPGKRRLISAIDRLLMRWTDRVVAVSQALKDELAAVEGINPDRICVVHNGIRFADLPRAEKTGTMVGTIARLAPQKGVEHFIRAAALVLKAHPEARFTVVGDGPFRAELESLAESLGIRQSIAFTGFREDALSLAAGFDVFVLASLRETFGITLVEALSQGVPVVASRTGGIPEIVDGSTTGLLAAPGSAEEIAAQVCKLLDDRGLAARLAENGRRFVRETFTAERMVSRTEALYAEV